MDLIFIWDDSGLLDLAANYFANTPITFLIGMHIITEEFPAGDTIGDWSMTVDWDDASGGDARYYIVARSSDYADNVQDIFVVGESSVAFNYESTPPQSFVTSVTSGTFYRSLIEIAGTVADTAIPTDAPG